MKKNKKKETMIFSEVVDSVKSLKEFLKMNAIQDDELHMIIVVWREEVEC